MSSTYTTISGQTWDQIAYELYGDEYLCDKLMEANRDKLNYFVFPDGVVLNTPDQEDMNQTSISSDYPTWRATLNG